MAVDKDATVLAVVVVVVTPKTEGFVVVVLAATPNPVLAAVVAAPKPVPSPVA